MQLRKAVVNYETYEVSEDQKIINTKTGKEIKPCNGPDGYMVVTLYNNYGRKTLRRCRIVATAFLTNPENKPCVNHIDGNKKNDAPGNLEWCTYSENELHSFRVLGKKANKPWQGKTNEKNHSSKGVKQYSLSGVLITEFPSLSEAKRKGFSASHISNVCNGKEKTHKGFIWKFSNN